MNREHLSLIANHVGLEPDAVRDFLEVARMCGYELSRAEDSVLSPTAEDLEILALREQSAFSAGFEAGREYQTEGKKPQPQLVKHTVSTQ